ncbi:hypothetical protein [Paucibacter sp. Y2R2-4]|uniref:hypothetical protein n=1 Tax=Paucibacter sp. Y2R2-4 TaxID=2893553 RepID=UPI0021E50D0E|nr:hypothetical protein [Paucibacter sp. Y2R2-4]MCV2351215.1 hypothetical protein [Paucibacter sp. Y2R2-4]
MNKQSLKRTRNGNPTAIPPELPEATLRAQLRRTGSYPDCFSLALPLALPLAVTFASCKNSRSESFVVLNCVLRGMEKVLSFPASADRRTLSSPMDDLYRKIRSGLNLASRDVK